MRSLEGQRTTPQKYITHLAGEVAGIGAYKRYREEGAARSIYAGLLQFFSPLSFQLSESAERSNTIYNVDSVPASITRVVEVTMLIASVAIGLSVNPLAGTTVKIGYNTLAQIAPDVINLAKIKLSPKK